MAQRSRRGLPGWIPVAGLIAILLVAAAAIAALSGGGSSSDKGTADIVPAKKHAAKPAPKKTKKATPAPTQTSTQAAPTSSSSTPATTPAPASGGSPSQMQLQAHSLIGQGQYDQAIALDKQVVAQGAGSGLTYAYALYDLGHALRLAGHPDQAIPVLEQRMKIDNQRGVVQAELNKAKAEAGSSG